MFLKNHTNGAEGGLFKHPTVQKVRISNVPADILQALDELAARQHRSRSSFVRRELRRIVADCRAKYALHGLYGRN